MRIFQRPKVESTEPGVTGRVRADRRVGAVLRVAQPGDILVIDHQDLDRGTAEALIDHGVVAVVNAAPFISGRYPNLGPELLARSGVMLVENVGTEAVKAIPTGARGAAGRVWAGRLYVNETEVGVGNEIDLEQILERMDSAREGLGTQLSSFTHNTVEFLRREQELLLHGRGVPRLDTRIENRPVVVVVRDFDHEEDLRMLRRFVSERKPVLIGVDAGADVLLSVKLKPDLVVVGEEGLVATGSSIATQLISDKALASAKEIILHADSSDRVLGAERLDRLGVRPKRISATGESEDIAILIADIEKASLIVTVGSHATLDEFLDKQRGGMSSTFLTQLRVGPRLVDAKAVPELYAGRLQTWHLMVVLVVGIIALLAAIATTPVGEDLFGGGLAGLIDRAETTTGAPQ